MSLLVNMLRAWSNDLQHGAATVRHAIASPFMVCNQVNNLLFLHSNLKVQKLCNLLRIGRSPNHDETVSYLTSKPVPRYVAAI